MQGRCGAPVVPTWFRTWRAKLSEAAAGFTVVTDIRKLPQRVADIYRRITR